MAVDSLGVNYLMIQFSFYPSFMKQILYLESQPSKQH